MKTELVKVFALVNADSAYNDTISLCAMKAQRKILADKLTLKERSGKTWEEFRNEMN